jgi:monoamine oxidase
VVDSCDVAVIGAGFAGAIAARDLGIAGRSVMLLEARDRVGGRTYTDEAFGRQLDFGGAYVHWTQPHVWRELQHHNIPLSAPIETGRVYWLADGAVRSGTPEDYGNAVAPAMTRYVADTRAQFPLPFDITAVDCSAIEKETMLDRLDSLHLSDYERDVLDGAMAALVHSYAEQGLAQLLLGVATYFGNWDAFFETTSVWPIEGGTRRVLDAIVAESTADLHLSTPVAAVDDDGDIVTVTTDGGEQIQARAVVVAVPLNTLSDIAIKPGLPAIARDMIDRKHPVLSSKIWVKVEGEIEPFTAMAPVGKNPINAARAEYRHDGDTLVMCLCSDAAALDTNDLDAVQAALRLFVPDIEVRETASHDWVGDPFSQGTFCMHRPGDLTEAAVLMRAPHGRIHFAGSDIAALDAGAIEGALESGARAARNVAAALAIGT